MEGQPSLFPSIKEDTKGVLDFKRMTIYADLNLKDLYKACHNCHLCDIAHDRKNIVFGKGNTNKPSIMFVGEAPGKDEDIEGAPFVGRSGRLLSKILEAVGIDEDADCYFTNIILCHPPGNRNPTHSEVENCLPRLIRQVQLIRPRALVLIGAQSCKAILGLRTVAISSIRGQWSKTSVNYMSEQLKIMPVFHPAYLLRTTSKEKGSPRWLTWQDFKELKEFVDEKV